MSRRFLLARFPLALIDSTQVQREAEIFNVASAEHGDANWPQSSTQCTALGLIKTKISRGLPFGFGVVDTKMPPQRRSGSQEVRRVRNCGVCMLSSPRSPIRQGISLTHQPSQQQAKKGGGTPRCLALFNAYSTSSVSLGDIGFQLSLVQL